MVLTACYERDAYSESSPWACAGNTPATTDVHPGQAGHDVIGAALSPLIGAALRDMALASDPNGASAI